MKNLLLILIFALSASLTISSCKKETTSPSTQTLSLNITGLENLGSNYVYEGWIMVAGTPISTGTFQVADNGTLSKTTFSINREQLEKATKFVLSIEPSNDTDPNPSDTKILVGDFSGNSAMVSTAIIGDFSGVAGKYILATPTDGMQTNEKSGIWFLDISSGSPTEGLTLPVLPIGWRYEGWVVIDGTPVTTGTFTNTKATDAFNGYSGSMALGMVNGQDGFFPGEDFLHSAPSGLSFPTDISGGKAVISIEPYPDNSPKPFTLKPLVGDIPATATDHTNYTLNKNMNMVTGSITR